MNTIRFILVFPLVALFLTVGCADKKAVEELSEASKVMEKKITMAEAQLAAVQAKNQKLSIHIELLNRWRNESRDQDAKSDAVEYMPKDDVEKVVSAAVKKQMAAAERIRAARERTITESGALSARPVAQTIEETAVAVADTAASEGEETREERRERRTQQWRKRAVDRLSETLELDEKQATRVTEIMSETQKGIAATLSSMRQDGNVDREAMREAFTKVRTDSEAAMKEVLTEEQFQKLQKMGNGWRRGGRDGRRNRRRRGGDDGDGGRQDRHKGGIETDE